MPSRLFGRFLLAVVPAALPGLAVPVPVRAWQDVVPAGQEPAPAAEAAPVGEGTAPGTQPEVEPPRGYQFEVERILAATSVKDQGRTGTCWSFATASFFESEIQRLGGPAVDLSEMFIVRNMYLIKARNFLLRQGKTNFGEGALAHDYIDLVGQLGIVPEEVFSGRAGEEAGHDHGELEAALRGMLEALVPRNRLTSKWRQAVEGVLDAYLGRPPESFTWEGRTWTPGEFRDHLGLRAADYVHLTSWSHHPWGQPFVLEIPDNVSGGSYLNVPLDDLIQTIDRALERGYTVAWDGDVSEAGFLADQGFAVLPAADRSQPWRDQPCDEPVVDQAARQEAFESLATTDDHLMHLVGRARDQNGRAYYIVKNSWGTGGRHGGQVYLSEGYVRLKTVAITVHRDVLQGDPAGPR